MQIDFTQRVNITDTATLVKLIKHCIEIDDMSLFYTSKEWRALRDKIIKEQKGECQDHKKAGLYVPAVMVHHEREVRDYPALALSKTYIDCKGRERRQLTALCDDCHKLRHKKYREPLTLERWD